MTVILPQNIFPKHIEILIQNGIKKFDFPIEEIRFRTGRRLILSGCFKHLFLEYIVTRTDIDDILARMCHSSIYVYTDEIKNGFLTLDGGHRAGLSGRAVIENGILKNITDINGINLRIAREIKDVTNCYIQEIISDNKINNTLIISPPGYGKTTAIRDIARILGATHRVSLIDERCEISAIHNGVPQFDVGDMTDIMELSDKSVGAEIMLRTMSPEVIIMDEISERDYGILEKIMSCGVKVIATAHGENKTDTLKRLGLPDEFVVITLPKRR